MNVVYYAWTCQECGIQVEEVQVGVNSDGQLIVTWTCLGCQREIVVYVPIEKLICDIPPSPEQINQQDKTWLKALHIEVPDG